MATPIATTSSTQLPHHPGESLPLTPLESVRSPFFAWFGEFSDHAARELPRSELLIALVLARHASRDMTSWPSVQRIAEMTGLSVPSVYRALEDLRNRGLVEWQELPFQGNRGQEYFRRVYRLRLPETIPPTPSHSHQQEHVLISRDKELLSTRTTHGTAHVTSQELSKVTGPFSNGTAAKNGKSEGATDDLPILTTEKLPNTTDLPTSQDSVRSLVRAWLQTHPGDMPLEQKARHCAYLLQAQGVRTYQKQVLEQMRDIEDSE